jgi:hypothetical protein
MTPVYFDAKNHVFVRRFFLLALAAVLIVDFASSSVLAQRTAPGRRPTQLQSKARDSKKRSVGAEVKVADSAKDPKIGQDWVRVKTDDDGEILGMQTAIVRYVSKANAGKEGDSDVPQVDLIGAVHIADVKYYDELNERFKKYDALLYELVAPEGTVVERGRGTSNAHPVGAMQNMAKDMLGLDHQLSEIDYTRPNFVHADMSPDDFAKAMADRKDSFLQMYFRLLGAGIAQQSEAKPGGANDLDLVTALFAPDRPRRLKIVLAKQLSEVETLMISFGGEDGSAIITDRNKKALAVLTKQLAAGKKKIGIFYGAGHLSDMDKRMREEYGMVPVSITWLTAWDLTKK